MRAEDANPQNFNVIEIIYDNGDFAIAYGNYKEYAPPCLAMRWNGEGDDAGYPKTFGHPMWLIFDNRLKIPFLKSLLGDTYAKNDKILDIILGKL